MLSVSKEIATNSLTERRAQINAALTKKRECENKAQAIVGRLLENPVDKDWLLDNAKYINQRHYEDVIEERALSNLCGYPLCINYLEELPEGHYKISGKSNKVYNLIPLESFCSHSCHKMSKHFHKQLFTIPIWLRKTEDEPNFHIISVPKSCLGNEVLLTGTVVEKVFEGVIGRENYSIEDSDTVDSIDLFEEMEDNLDAVDVFEEMEDHFTGYFDGFDVFEETEDHFTDYLDGVDEFEEMADHFTDSFDGVDVFEEMTDHFDDFFDENDFFCYDVDDFDRIEEDIEDKMYAEASVDEWGVEQDMTSLVDEIGCFDEDAIFEGSDDFDDFDGSDGVDGVCDIYDLDEIDSE